MLRCIKMLHTLGMEFNFIKCCIKMKLVFMVIQEHIN
jgi:hypothetical protein